MFNNFTVSKEEENLRLDKALKAKFSSYSRSYLQNLINSEKVIVNKKIEKKRYQTKIGDSIEVFLEEKKPLKIIPENIDLSIIYEDEHIIVIDKPCGMVVHPAPGNFNKTFVNALLYHCSNIEFNKSSLRPGIVHRLDKHTTGLLIAAKTIKSHQKLIQAFSDGKINKTYIGICIGNPGNKTIDFPIGRSTRDRKKMTTTDKGKHAKTIFKTICSNEKLSLVEIKPITGRTHQIRVHLRFNKTPILGDNTYGYLKINNFYKTEYHLLHAQKISFNHPITGETLELEAETPKEIKQYIDTINN